MLKQEVTDVNCDRTKCCAEYYAFLTEDIKTRMKVIRDSLQEADMRGLILTKERENEIRIV